MTVAAPPEGAAGTVRRDPGSFRDPSGFVYRRDGAIYRQIQDSFADRWAAVEATGVLQRLAADGRMLPYEEAPLELAAAPGAARVIKPAIVPFISYPYEWSFEQLRDAALLTLDIQEAALGAGLTLRDASAYNVQFLGARPVHIDHLSLEPAEAGRPWIAYRQFCEHFLGPLALMAKRDIRLGRLLRSELDGIPLDLVSRLLPGSTRLRLGLGAHIHLHARAQRRYAGAGEAAAERVASTRKINVANLVTSLRDTIKGLVVGAGAGPSGPTTTRTRATTPPRPPRRSGSSPTSSAGRPARPSGTSARTPAASAGSPPTAGERSWRWTSTRPRSTATTGRSARTAGRTSCRS